MGRTEAEHRQVALDVIEALDDEGLRAVTAHARGRLLDWPVAPTTGPGPALTVEVVGADEESLLACYRVLDPTAQLAARCHAARLVRGVRTSVWEPAASRGLRSAVTPRGA